MENTVRVVGIVALVLLSANAVINFVLGDISEGLGWSCAAMWCGIAISRD